MAGCAHPAFARADQAVAAGSAQAEVVRPLLVTRERDLAFGGLFAGNLPGRVTVTAQAQTIYEGGVAAACAVDDCTRPHPASFLVSGEPGRSYQVSVPTAVEANGHLIGAGGGVAAALRVEGLTTDTLSRPGSGGNGRLSETGQDRFTIGGTLRIPARLPAASYRARIPVIVTYG
ncbi:MULTISPECIES: DUF4402 domain-containing protein [unclassified Novosphingobium]|uniref:DUF4402 domain-containing protein n=1 Tax=unclassified Novosphingobium TaxID=2644732 RepID=UPI0026003DCF|nr:MULTISPECIES: DUF4402 domain-containing protein [unclassified Novosphingobium]HQS68930.1 DUF4402 domain-containing protein [Novosphingobium sp.]